MAQACDRGCRGGHLLREGKWVRCECLEEAIYKRDLGIFATKAPKMDTKLLSLLDSSIVIEGPLNSIRPHIAGVILDLKRRGKSFASTDAYRLVDIFLDKDQDFSNSAMISDYDLYVMMLGFAEVKNQRLPDLICQVLARRQLLQKPTWVILGMPFGQVAQRFTSDVHDRMKDSQKVVIR